MGNLLILAKRIGVEGKDNEGAEEDTVLGDTSIGFKWSGLSYFACTLTDYNICDWIKGSGKHAIFPNSMSSSNAVGLSVRVGVEFGNRCFTSHGRVITSMLHCTAVETSLHHTWNICVYHCSLVETSYFQNCIPNVLIQNSQITSCR